MVKISQFYSRSVKPMKPTSSFLSDQQPRHASADSEGLCEAALHLHAASRLRPRRGENHHLQGTTIYVNIHMLNWEEIQQYLII